MIVGKTIHSAHVGKYGDKNSPWVHLNLLDISPPGHPILDVLRDPNGRTARIKAWADALARFDKGLPYILSTRWGVGIVGVSIEGEQLVPVPHDMSMVAGGDTPPERCAAVAKVLGVVAKTMGVPYVVPYGSAQVLAAHVTGTVKFEHLIQSGSWYLWNRPGGSTASVRQCQAFNVLPGDSDFKRSAWVWGALDRHASTGRVTKANTLTVFVAPEVVGAGSGENDPPSLTTPEALATIYNDIDTHPIPCRVVSWFKASTQTRADAAREAVNIAKEHAGLQ